MFLLDVNIVVAAHRDDHPHHEVVRGWLDEALAGPDDLGVPATVWASFLRLSTNRRVFAVPTPMADAFAFVDAFVAHPRHVAAEPGPRHLGILRRLCEEGEVMGDLVPDAVLGAIAIEQGASLVTLDRDFARFEEVAHLRPGG